MNNQRIAKVNSLIQHEVSLILAQEIFEKQVGLLTVMRVDTTPDLSACKVWVSPFQEDVSLSTIENIIKRHIGRIQHELNDILRTKRKPRLKFIIDQNSQYVEHINKIIDEERSA